MLNCLKLYRWSATQPSAQGLADSRMDRGAMAALIPRKFETLEVWLLLFCGAYGLLVAGFMVHGTRDIMLACVGLICMASWRRFHPARTRLQWMQSASVALLLAGWIYFDPSSGGVAGPFLYLLLLMAAAYPLFMDMPSASVFIGGMLAVYFVSIWRQTGAVPHDLMLLRAVLITGMAGLSVRFGKVLLYAEEHMDTLRRDSASQVYNEHGLLRYGARLLEACGREMQPCTLVQLTMQRDWNAMVQVGGHVGEKSALDLRKLQNRALQDMAQNLTDALPYEAIVSRSVQGDWVVLIPWLDRKTAITMLEKNFGRPLQLSFGPRKLELFVVLMPCAVQSNGSDDTVDKMLARAQDIWQRGVRTGAVEA